jgi:hypothetical protein
LFEQFDAMLRQAGYIAMSGQIVNASLVAAPYGRFGGGGATIHCLSSLLINPSFRLPSNQERLLGRMRNCGSSAAARPGRGDGRG